MTMNDTLNCLTVKQLLAKYPERYTRRNLKIVNVISGDRGDFIYYLPVVRYMYENGFTNCNNYLFVLADRGQRSYLTDFQAASMFGAIIPPFSSELGLLDYTYRYSYGFFAPPGFVEKGFHDPDKIEYVDQSAFREPLRRLLSARFHAGIKSVESLVEYQLRYQLDRTPTESLNDLEDLLFYPFLKSKTRDSKRSTKLIAYSFSGRYFDRKKFIDLAYKVFHMITTQSGEHATHIFLGSESEYALLDETLRRHVTHYPTPEPYQLVDVLQNCGLLVCNQSFPFALAQACNTPTILAESNDFPDSLIGRTVNPTRALEYTFLVPEGIRFGLNLPPEHLITDFLKKFGILQ